MICRLLKLSLFLFCFLSLHAQNEKKSIDSIKHLILEQEQPKELVELNIHLGKVYNRRHPDSALIYFRRAQKISEEKQLVLGRLKSYNSIAAAQLIKGSFDSAHYYFKQSESLLDKVKDFSALSAYYGDKGILFYYQGNYKEAALSFKEALRLSIEHKSESDILKFSNNTALVLTQLDQNEEAIDIYYDALNLSERIKDTLQMGKILNNIGLLYENMSQYENALGFYERALKLKKINGTHIDLVHAYYNLGNMQLMLGRENQDSLYVREAKQNFETVWEEAKKNKYKQGELYGLEGLGKIAKMDEDFSLAKEYYETMVRVSKENNNTSMLGVAYLNLGDIFVLQGDFNKGDAYLMKAKPIIEEVNQPKDMALLYANLSELYQNQGKMGLAFQYLKKQKAIEDKMSTKNLQDKMSAYEVKYQTAKKDAAILESRAVIAENDLKLKQKNLLLYGLIALALVISLLGYLLINQQKLKNKQLKKENQLKIALAKIETQNKLQDQRLHISRDLHDNIGAQLTFIISSMENLIYIFKIKDEQVVAKVSSISAFARKTIRELRDTIWAMNKTHISFDDLKVRISNFIKEAEVSTANITFKFTMEPKENGQLIFTSLQGINIYRTIQEAINNTIKYADASLVTVAIKIINDEVNIMVSDNGKGFSLSEVERGNGLNNMEKRMKEIGGEVHITSKKGKGTEIKITMNKHNG